LPPEADVVLEIRYRRGFQQRADAGTDQSELVLRLLPGPPARAVRSRLLAGSGGLPERARVLSLTPLWKQGTEAGARLSVEALLPDGSSRSEELEKEIADLDVRINGAEAKLAELEAEYPRRERARGPRRVQEPPRRSLLAEPLAGAIGKSVDLVHDVAECAEGWLTSADPAKRPGLRRGLVVLDEDVQALKSLEQGIRRLL
jgi:hypothetical protein